jgi:hypothetical protein
MAYKANNTRTFQQQLQYEIKEARADFLFKAERYPLSGLSADLVEAAQQKLFILLKLEALFKKEFLGSRNPST